MLPLRQAFALFQRSLTGVPPTLRTPRQQSVTTLIHRCRPRAFSTSPFRLQDDVPRPQTNSSSAPETAGTPPAPQTHITLETPEPRLSITFTCTVEACHTRSSHQFTKRSYEKGIVIVQCPGCKNRHLIADHLGWFKESTEDGKLKTVEDLLRAKGEKVRRGRIDAGGVVEYAPE